MENNREAVIEVKDVKKKFKVYYDKGNSLKERILFRNRRKYENREVLKGITFEVKKGEAAALIGHNGCGKSTMLKLLTRIMYPDSGRVEVKGRIASLIELGAGFHPDMSGRENIYTNASIFGLTKSEIEERIQRIIDFSEIEQYIDNPVRTYSSGMYMRLAFSVAINVDADVLLIDEILGVGDANYQEKCFKKLKELKAGGTTIVIVSHSLSQVEQICDRSLWIHDGVIRSSGDPKTVDLEYLDFMTNKSSGKSGGGQKIEIEPEGMYGNRRWGNGKAKITDIRVLSDKDEEKEVFQTGDAVKIKVKYEVSEPVKDAVFGIGISNINGVNCYGTNTRIDRAADLELIKGGTFELFFDSFELVSGSYLIDLAIEEGNGIPVDYFKNAASIELNSPVSDVGICRLTHSWSIKEEV